MLLVTGGAGFIGANFVVSSLAATGEAIVNLDKLTYAGNLKNLDVLADDGRHEFVQDNHSRSARNVLRGLHYQVRQPQGKLVRVVSGEIWDVAVDLRRASPSFGRWVAAKLDAASHRMLWIPPGFAHGFVVLSEQADVVYKVTVFYAPEHERTLLWSDPALCVPWPLAGEPVMTDKDRRGVPLAGAETFD